MRSILYKFMSKFTSLNEVEQQDIVEGIPIEEYKKGTVLLRQGDVPSKCFCVKGMCEAVLDR